jgi:hypothetical protein
MSHVDDKEERVRVVSHANVYNSALRVLRGLGFELEIKLIYDGEEDGDGNVELPPPDHEVSVSYYGARKGRIHLEADNPLELLGLAKVVEGKSPPQPAAPYWWVVEGDDDIGQELWDKAVEEYQDDYFGRLFQADHEAWRSEIAKALADEAADPSVSAIERLGVSKDYFDRINFDDV